MESIDAITKRLTENMAVIDDKGLLSRSGTELREFWVLCRAASILKACELEVIVAATKTLHPDFRVIDTTGREILIEITEILLPGRKRTKESVEFQDGESINFARRPDALIELGRIIDQKANKPYAGRGCWLIVYVCMYEVYWQNELGSEITFEARIKQELDKIGQDFLTKFDRVLLLSGDGDVLIEAWPRWRTLRMDS